jgi:hypothetical protein
MKDARKLIVVLCVLAASVVLAACGSSDDSTTGTSGEESAAVTGEFAPVADAAPEYSGVAGEAELQRSSGGTVVSMTVSGLEPKTQYMAHLHTGGCDQADPGGPHFQFKPGDSEEPPNELHLQFTSDAAGDGEATTSSKQEVPVGEAGSVVLHLDESHEMSAFGEEEPEAETVFVHEGVDHSKEGPGHEAEPEHAHSDKIACAELEGAAAGEGESTADSGDVPTIVVRNGEPVGGVQELEFDAGEDVRFRVSSDQAEEIHVHGYDISQDVSAGGTTEFDFPAEIEGIFEAELEELGVQIVELRINP